MAAPFEDIRMILQAEAVYPLLIQTLDEGGAVPSICLVITLLMTLTYKLFLDVDITLSHLCEQLQMPLFSIDLAPYMGLSLPMDSFSSFSDLRKHISSFFPSPAEGGRCVVLFKGMDLILEADKYTVQSQHTSSKDSPSSFGHKLFSLLNPVISEDAFHPEDIHFQSHLNLHLKEESDEEVNKMNIMYCGITSSIPSSLPRRLRCLFPQHCSLPEITLANANELFSVLFLNNTSETSSSTSSSSLSSEYEHIHDLLTHNMETCLYLQSKCIGRSYAYMKHLLQNAFLFCFQRLSLPSWSNESSAPSSSSSSSSSLRTNGPFELYRIGKELRISDIDACIQQRAIDVKKTTTSQANITPTLWKDIGGLDEYVLF